MPLGETIGRAYIRILADGSGLGDDIQRQMRAHDGDFSQAGEQASTAWQTGYRREMRKLRQDPFSDMERALREGAGRFDAVGELVGSTLMDGLRDELEERFEDVGTVMFRNFKEKLQTGEIDWTGVKRSLRNLNAEVAAATREITADQVQQFKDLGDAVERYSQQLIRTRATRQHFLLELQTLGARLPETITNTDDFRESVEKMTQVLLPADRRLGRFQRTLSGVGNTMGKVFGRGSRNDFLNFFGGFVSLLPRALGGISQGMLNLIAGVRDLGREFQRLRDIGHGTGQALLAMAQEGLPGIIAAAAAVGIALQGMLALSGAFASAIVLATGIVLALAGSLAFALVGGLVAVAGALVPFAAALGVAAIAMGGLDKKSKTLKTLKKDWKDLQKELAKVVFGPQEGFFGPKGSDNLSALSDILKTIRPLLLAVGGALGGVIASFGAASRGKEFRDLIADITAILPGMITTLGSIAGNIGVALGEAFVAAEPLITKFLGWLDKVTQGIADSGKGGKDSPMAKFFADVADSAEIIGPLILEIIGLVGDLFDAGKGTGDSMFTKIHDTVVKIRDKLAEWKANGTLDKFFDDAEKLAGKLGEVLTAVKDVIAALDTPMNRSFLFITLDIITRVLNGLAWLITKAEEAKQSIADFVSTIDIGGSIKGFLDSIDIGGAITGFFDSIDVGGAISGFFNSIDISGAIDGLKQPFIDFWDWLVGNSLIPDLIDEIVRLFTGLPGKIAAGLGDLGAKFATWVATVPGKIKTAVLAIVNAFTGLATKIIAKAGSIAGKFAAWVATLPGKARAMATSIANGFSNLAGNIITKAGSIASKVTTWLASLPGKAKTAATSIANGFSGLAGDMIAKAGSIASRVATWLSGLYAKGLAAGQDIARGFAAALTGFLSNISLGSLNISAAVQRVLDKYTARGGVFFGAQTRIIGEAGPEAVVPLNRPLSMVDPAVRELSAFAQGLRPAAAVPGSGDRTLVGSITIITPTEDPRAVASEVVARMATASYFG